MHVLVTGAKGFIGKNLIETLGNIQDGKDRSFDLDQDLTIDAYDVDTDPVLLDAYCQKADFVFHLAGVNRPQDPSEFMAGNYGFTSQLLDTLKKYGNNCPIMVSSSIQAALDNPYGQSKRKGEELLQAYGEETGAAVYIYRFPNVFGKWCRPNYNSVVATFCHNIAHGLPIQVNDPAVQLTLVYVDDVVRELICALSGQAHRDAETGFCKVPTEHQVTLQVLSELLYSFADSRKNRMVPDMTERSFAKKLYSTYLSYLPEDGFAYPLQMHVDDRGSFTEILRTVDRGQFSVNISKPGITKGEHWHHSKNEKFVVVSGEGLIRFRKVGTDPETGEAYPILDYPVSGAQLQVVDIPTGYTHNIINTGDTDLVTFMWCNECFDAEKPDTYFLKVEE